MRYYMGEVCTDEKSGSLLTYYTLKNKRGFGIEIRQSHCENPEISAVYGITENQAEISLLTEQMMKGQLRPGQLVDVVDDYLDGKSPEKLPLR